MSNDGVNVLVPANRRLLRELPLPEGHPHNLRKAVFNMRCRFSISTFVCFCVALTLTSIWNPACAQKLPDLEQAVLSAVHWRSIGPANTGGRVSDIAVDPQNSYTYYVAMATGGVIKTTDNGTTWTAVFNHEAVASVGAVAVAPSNPSIVWVGTGEANGRNSSSWGDGVYKSTDGGHTWTHMGLDHTREIARVVIDPKNPDIVYVAAMGDLWGYNASRGLYKTVDGGKTWKNVLNLGPKTGVTDVVLGPPGTHLVVAASYSRLRKPWGYYGLNHRNTIYRSTDDGATWNKVKGLPSHEVGRIGLSIAASKPNIIYSVVECDEGGARNLFDTNSKYGGVFKSTDSGATWVRVNHLAPRGFYFGQIRVDPTNPDIVYVLGFGLAVSKDGGKTFVKPGYGGPIHPDLHAMWIDPQHADHLLLGTDGGLFTSYDANGHWQAINNFPMGEFYEVSVDTQQPYWIYGGMQDNSCWMGPSNSQSYPGITNSDWKPLNGGDGFYAFADPRDPKIVYAESQNGGIQRLNHHTHTARGISPVAPEGYPDFRFNWNTPMMLDRFNPGILYVGGSVLLRFTNHCRDWTQISPDLSKQVGPHITSVGSGAETYGTIVCIAQSPLDKETLWAGTDDGNVQVTEDGGKTWTNITNNLPSKVREYWVTRIVASHFFKGRAYVSIDGHRSNDLAPFIFETDDYGKSWRSIVSNLPAEGPVQALKEDGINRNLLFAGTEFAAWATFDGGKSWHKLNGNLPTVAVDDLAIQPRDHSLVAGTHGRSVWVLDNITELETLAAKPKADQPLLFPVQPALEYNGQYQPVSGQWPFLGHNPPRGLNVNYWLPALEDGGPQIVVKNGKGKVVYSANGSQLPGLQSVSWDMRVPAPPNGWGPGDHAPKFVTPGSYTVTFTIGKISFTEPVTISGDPSLSAIPGK